MTEPNGDLQDALDELDAAYGEMILKLRDHGLDVDHPLAEPLDTLLLCVGRLLECYGPAEPHIE
jgi:hypothetical protein